MAKKQIKKKSVKPRRIASSRTHLFVSGIVQGVFYRDFTIKTAKKYKLVGWVKNLDDGRVEIVAEGSKTNIQKFINELWSGPFESKVEDLAIRWEKATGEFKSFLRN